MTEDAYDPAAIVAALQRRKVRFVVVGGIAAIAQGSPLPTEDVDITPERSTDNLEALAAALVDLDAKLRTAEGPVEFPLDARMIAGNALWHLTTPATSISASSHRARAATTIFDATRSSSSSAPARRSSSRPSPM